MNPSPPPPPAANYRETAARLIAKGRRHETPPDQLLASVTDHRSEVMELVYGVIRRQRTLDWLVGRLAKRRPKGLIDACLHTGLFELFFKDSSAEHAVLHETVEAARALGGNPVARFVNAILRRAQREKTELLEALEAAPQGIRWSHPDLLLERWLHHVEPGEVEQLCVWDNTPPDVIVRPVPINEQAAGILLEQFTRDGIEAWKHPVVPDMLVLPHGVRVTELPGYREGACAVQDPATLLAPRLLAPKPGEAVLDACAAPGGKTAVLSELMQQEGTLVALDKSSRRLRRLQENFERLNLSWIETLCADASSWTPTPSRLFDAILLDVPCTNTGVLRRRPDARWSFSESKLQELKGFQLSLLNQAVHLLAPGGRIVYSTCSLEEDENRGLINGWLQEQPDFSLVSEAFSFPPRSGMDGAYAVLLQHQARATSSPPPPHHSFTAADTSPVSD